MKNYTGARRREAHAVGCRGFTSLTQNILRTSPDCQVSPQTQAASACHCSCASCRNHNTSKQQKSDLPLSCANHHALSETGCKNKTTNGRTFAPLICQDLSVLHLSRAGKVDGEPSSGKKIITKFASEPASLLCFLTDASGQRPIVSFIHFIIPCQIFSINFAHIIPA